MEEKKVLVFQQDFVSALYGFLNGLPRKDVDNFCKSIEGSPVLNESDVLALLKKQEESEE